jgi:hypothetical protein
MTIELNAHIAALNLRLSRGAGGSVSIQRNYEEKNCDQNISAHGDSSQLRGAEQDRTTKLYENKRKYS